MKSSRERELQQLRAQGLARRRSSYFDGSIHGRQSGPAEREQDECISSYIAQQQQNGTKYFEASKSCDDDGIGLGFLLSLSSASSDGSHLPSHEIEPSESVLSPASSITTPSTPSITWHEVHMQNREMTVFQQKFRNILFGSVGLDEEEIVFRDQSPPISECPSDEKEMTMANPPAPSKASPEGLPSRKYLSSKTDPSGYERMTSMDPPSDEDMIISSTRPPQVGQAELGDYSGSTTDSLSSFEYASHDTSYFNQILNKVKRWHRRRRKSQYQDMNNMCTDSVSPDDEAHELADGQESLEQEKETSTTGITEKEKKKSSTHRGAQKFYVAEKRSSIWYKEASIWCHRCGYQFLASITMFLLLAGIITAVVVLSKSGAEASPPSPLQSRRQVLRTMIELISGIESLSNSTNPHYQAFEWMSTVDTTVLDSSPLAVAKTAERYIIALFYFAMKGDEWTEQYDFLSPGPVCRWNDRGSEKIYRHGVVCDDNGNVLRIQVSENNLVGTLPQELERLEYLEFLHLPRNNITATIPSRLNLPNLQHLDLKSNQISGSIPTDLSRLQSLRYLNLGSNRLEGSIPSSIGRLSHLEFLSLGRNMLGSRIPEEMGTLQLAKTIDLSFNKLEGTVPDVIGSLATLQVLRLQRNSLTGHLGTDFCSRDYVSLSSDCLDTASSSVTCSCCDTCCDETVCCGATGCPNV